MASKLPRLFLLLFLSLKTQSSAPGFPIKSGYYYSGHEFPVSAINSKLFNHLICAFAYINSSTYELSINTSTEDKFSTFTNTVMRKNPSIKTLLSIWAGREYSSIFSSMLNRYEYRKSFIESSIKTARMYGFHGIDLSGVLPSKGLINLGTLLEEWRVALTSESRNSSGSELILVMAGRYWPTLESLSYPVESIQRNVDWVHIVAYDYYVPEKGNFTNFHASLFDPSNQIANTDNGIKEWMRIGVSANKLVLGLPYHGYAWTLENSQNNSIGSLATGPALTIDGSVAYKYIKWFIQTYGYGVSPVYNATYVVSYCTVGSSWINFDDLEAIKTKVTYAKENGLLGYNVFQVVNDDNWVLSRAAQEAAEDKQKHKPLLLIIMLTTTVVLFIGSLMCLLRRVLKPGGIMLAVRSSLYKLNTKMHASRSSHRNSPSLIIFTFENIKSATNNFSSENRLGEGGFGPVFKGKWMGQEIAVKRLSKTSSQGIEEFKNEVALAATLQHVNLLGLLGYCTEREEKMLIYDYMPNQSLDLYLLDPTRRHVLDWRKRVLIIEGITQGLLYLQEYSNYTIIHRDLKGSNVLLDNKMNPKISDFGLARMFSKDVHEANTSRIVGTYGYVPPEYVRNGAYSMKYDVYSFGVLLLQIISGKRTSCYYGIYENLNLLEYAYESWKQGQATEFFDPSLDDSSSSCKLITCLQVALLCVQENPIDRPSMLEVSSMLKNESAAIMTPKQPAFSIKKDEATEEENYPLRDNFVSINDSTMSELMPR